MDAKRNRSNRKNKIMPISRDPVAKTENAFMEPEYYAFWSVIGHPFIIDNITIVDDCCLGFPDQRDW